MSFVLAKCHCACVALALQAPVTARCRGYLEYVLWDASMHVTLMLPSSISWFSGSDSKTERTLIPIALPCSKSNGGASSCAAQR